jgi:hypothetical protein
MPADESASRRRLDEAALRLRRDADARAPVDREDLIEAALAGFSTAEEIRKTARPKSAVRRGARAPGTRGHGGDKMPSSIESARRRYDGRCCEHAGHDRSRVRRLVVANHGPPSIKEMLQLAQRRKDLDISSVCKLALPLAAGLLGNSHRSDSRLDRWHGATGMAMTVREIGAGV